MLKKLARSLDALVGTLPTLNAALKLADAIDDAAFKRFLEKSGRPKLAKKSDTVSPEYAKALVAAAIIELKKLQRFAESDDVADEFPEMLDGDEASDDSTEEADGEVPVAPEGGTEESEDDARIETDDSGLGNGLGDDPEVEVTIEGEGVEIVHAEDSKLYMVLPDNSVLKMQEASEHEAKIARRLLVRQKNAKSLPVKTSKIDPEEIEITVEGRGVRVATAADNKFFMVLPDNSVLKVEETVGREARIAKHMLMRAKRADAAKLADPMAEEKKAKDEAGRVRSQAVKTSEVDRSTVRTDKAIRKETQATARNTANITFTKSVQAPAVVQPASRRRSAQPLTKTPARDRNQR